MPSKHFTSCFPDREQWLTIAWTTLHDQEDRIPDFASYCDYTSMTPPICTDCLPGHIRHLASFHYFASAFPFLWKTQIPQPLSDKQCYFDSDDKSISDYQIKLTQATKTPKSHFLPALRHTLKSGNSDPLARRPPQRQQENHLPHRLSLLARLIQRLHH